MALIFEIPALALLITLLVGIAGGYLGYRSRIPGGPLIGSLLFVCALNVLTGGAKSLAAYKITAQTIAGIFIGLQLANCSVKSMLKLWKPILVVVLGMFTVNIVSAFVVYASSGNHVDLVTAFFATTPGGIAEMSIMAGDMNANTLTVSVMQFARLIFALCVFPTTAQWIIKRLAKKGEAQEPEQDFSNEDMRYSTRNTVLIVALATLSGIAGYYSNIAGAMLFLPMLVVAILGQLHINTRIPFNFKRAAQTLSGICIGSGIAQADIMGLPELIIPILLMLATYFVLCLSLGFVLYKFCHLDSSAAFFSCIPAGVSDMALIASDFGTGGPIVAVLQLCRFAGVVFATPAIISFITHFFA